MRQLNSRTAVRRALPVIGVDPSLRSTGIAVIRAYEEIMRKEVWSGTITPRDIVGTARLAYLGRATAEIFKQYPRAMVVVEAGSFGSKGRSSELAEWRGIVKYLAHEHGHQVYQFPPKSLKLFATGSGNAEKKDMLREAKLFGTPKNSDEADAIMLAFAGMFRQSPNMLAPIFRHEGLRSLRRDA